MGEQSMAMDMSTDDIVTVSEENDKEKGIAGNGHVVDDVIVRPVVESENQGPPGPVEEITLVDDEDDRSVSSGKASTISSINGAQGRGDVSMAQERGDVSGAQGRGDLKRKKPMDEAYIQELTCIKASKFLTRCRDCMLWNENSPIPIDDVCRFSLFRKLVNKKVVQPSKYKNPKTGFYILADGFLNPVTDPTQDDIDIWIPNPKKSPAELELNVCKQIITQLGDQMCSLIRQENEALEIEASFNGQREKVEATAWKRPVEGVREMCDVCATTLFNHHWICTDCGFVTCIECFKSRMKEIKWKGKRTKNQSRSNARDEYNWLTCCKCQPHTPIKMRLAQIIPKNVMNEFNEMLHRVRNDWDIQQLCNCSIALHFSNQHNKITQLSKSAKSQEEGIEGNNARLSGVNTTDPNDSDEEDDEDESCCIQTLLQPASKNQTETTTNNGLKPEDNNVQQASTSNLNQDNQNPTAAINNGDSNASDLKHYIRHQNKSYYEKAHRSAKFFTDLDTNMQYPSMQGNYNWLCQGSLLRLLTPDHEDNDKLFKPVWECGQPVVVSNVSGRLNENLWTPESFLKEYGHERNDLVNCLTGKTLPKQLIKDFWEGFIDEGKRMFDVNGTKMLLKLKDWPSKQDFAEFSPRRFDDLMQALPLKEYTHRNGRLNLAARLPTSFGRPDLGPKMYIAYGHGSFLDKGTTVLHLDMSDAVNVMVYVGKPKNCDPGLEKAVLEAIINSDCDDKTVDRVIKDGELPGALWHIYRPCDADKIRDLLNKTAVDEGKAIEPENDPIHDQVAYLDRELRKKLREEYNVHGFPILQCAGDCVFIPAGAPHQVRNLYNCIKIAEDYVSPENVSHCFQLTDEFRNLSDTHYNHEDKLQIKNIVYHAVKDAMSVLMHAKLEENAV